MTKQASISFFSDYSNLEYFLRTNNYWVYYQKVLPSLFVHRLERALGPDKRAIRVLDIGCGSGDFSIPIFEKIAQQFAVEVTAFDPSAEAVANFKQRYTKPHKSVLIDAIAQSFQNFEVMNAFDLVFAAHSLYEPFETSDDRTLSGAEICRKLKSLTAPGGLMCIIMASNDSMVYELKREAYAILGDPNHFMMTGETFREFMHNEDIDVECQFADTYMDVSAFSSSSPSSALWLSYLLRMNAASLADDLRSQLIYLVEKRSLRFRSLPEATKADYESCHALIGPPNDETRLLFHKETVLTAQT